MWSSCIPDRACLAGLCVSVLSGQPRLVQQVRDLLGGLGARENGDGRPGLVLADPSWPEAFDRCFEHRCRPDLGGVPIVSLPGDPPYPARMGCRLLTDASLGEDFADPDYLAETIASAMACAKGTSDDGLVEELSLEIESASEPLVHAAELLFTWSATTPLEHNQRLHLRQGALEMLQNAAEWGHKSRRDLLIRMDARVFRDRISVVIADQGEGFDLDNLPHAATADDPLRHMDVREAMGLREGGFGLLLSRGMMDELRHNETGNCVTLTKRFRSTGPSASPTGGGG
jgi:anti-sigma regulatory factor (Ser/Thr protein kinase)